MFKWKTSTQCQLGCRPDGLSELCSSIILSLGGSGAVRVGSVETRGNDVASFLCTVEVPTHLKQKFESVVTPFRTAS